MYFLLFPVLPSSLVIPTGKGMDHSFIGGPRDTGLWTEPSVVARSRPPPLKSWRTGKKVFSCQHYSPNDIYNGDETALFYKCLPHRTYCFNGDKPAGSAKCKDRLTLLMITNMDGSDHRKLAVIGKYKTLRCLAKKYSIQIKDMAVT